MFLQLDKKDRSAIAAIDDSQSSVTYGDICDFAQQFSLALPRRTLIFILADNCIGSLLGYTSALSNRIVPLVLSNNTDKGLFNNLFSLYNPEYLWIPDTHKESYPYNDVILSEYGYSLVSTGLHSTPLNDELALLLPTSGSTGSPKLVRHSYRNIEANAYNVQRLFGLTPRERAMAILPMHYTMGLSVIASHLFAGATILLSNKSLLDRGFWSFLKEGKATSFTGVPYSYEILSKMRFFKMDLPDLKLITQGGGKLTDELFKQCADYAAQSGKKFIATYGQTECTARMAYLPAEMATKKIGSIGIAEPGGQLSIIDNEGNETFDGEASGEMVYRGENVTLGYATSQSDLFKGDENNGIMHTGDVVRRDADGCYFIIGRLKRFLKIYGLRIGLDEVELMVKSQFNTDCYCSGNDEVLKVNITNKEIANSVISFIEEKTHLFHKNIEVCVIDSISRNEAGKVVLH